MFLDLGFDATSRWLIACLEANIDFAELTSRLDTPRAVLNRHCQKRWGFVPDVSSVEVGIGTDRLGRSHVSRVLDPRTTNVVAIGSGASRKESDAHAVQNALMYYDLSVYRHSNLMT